MKKEQVMQMNAKEFMAELYKDVPSDKVTYIFTLPDHVTYPYTIGQMDRMLDKARAFNESILGYPLPDSHLDTAARET